MRFLLLAMVLALSSPAAADVLRVTPAGNSITNGYAGTTGGRLRLALQDRGIEATVSMAALSGNSAQLWLDNGVLTLVEEADPDAVLLMLGTNDAARVYAPEDRAQRIADYQAAMTQILDALDAMDLSVVLSTLIPIRAPYEHHELAYEVILEDLNPWIRQEAASRDLTLWDSHDLLIQQPGWEGWYNDGIHLWGSDGNDLTGYTWMAGSAADTTLQAVPEPAVGVPLLLGLLALRRRRP